MSPSKKKKEILLGYEAKTAEPVFVPLHHLVVTGSTQLSGKTTTLEALISRSGMTSIAFRTKRGEGGFRIAAVHRHEPFFRERADWRYVQGLLEATMREKMRFERAWIINASKGAATLRDVYDNIVERLKKAKGQNASVLTTLQAYLDIVLPEIEKIDFVHELNLKPGLLNVMDLVDLQDEVQQLVIASTLEELHKNATNTIVVIPEAWRFVPEGMRTPVKYPLEAIARQGAGVGLYLFLDSQDITGVDKAILKQVDTWLIGRQREKNEVERAIAQLPIPKKQRPKPEEVMNFPIGHFVAAFNDKVKLVYVQPAWLPDLEARHIAETGDLEVARDYMPASTGEHLSKKQLTRLKEDGMASTREKQLERENSELHDRINALENEIRELRKRPPRRAVASDPAVDEEVIIEHCDPVDSAPTNGERMPGPRTRYDVDVTVAVPNLTVRERVVVVNATSEDERGRVAILIADGFFDSPRGHNDACSEFRARGWGKWSGGPEYAKMKRLLVEMASMGFFRNEGKSFVITPEAKERIKRVKERS